MSFNNLGLNIKRLVENTGSAEGAAEKLREILHETDSNGNPTADAKRVKEEFSLRECAEQLRREGYEHRTLRLGYLAEAVHTSQFAVITSELLSSATLTAYEAYPKILDQLVTPISSRLQIDRIPGVYASGEPEVVPEGKAYNEDADIKDKYVTVTGKKRGKILNVSEESVIFDQTGLVMQAAADLGELAAINREKRGLYTILDISNGGTNYYCWRPAGTRTAIWQNAQGSGDAHEYDNLITDVLTDYTDLDAAKVLLGTMKDDNGNNIAVPADTLLVPLALDTQGNRLISNTVVPGGANSENNPFANKVQVLHSPLIDGCGDGNASTMWYWGNFKRQFGNKVVYPLQVLRRRFSDSHDPAFERDIVLQVKVREYSEVFARDYRYVVKSTGAG